MKLKTGVLVVVMGVVLQAGCARQSDISFFVLVKSSNYAQDSSGVLTLLNYHFFSEIFLSLFLCLGRLSPMECLVFGSHRPRQRKRLRKSRGIAKSCS